MQTEITMATRGACFRLADPALGLVLALLIAALPAAAADLRSVTITGELKVFDGDTLEVGPLVIRLHAVDAPELSQSCARPGDGTWPCGERAAERLIALRVADDLSCEGLDRDRYGRVIARCIAGGQDGGARLVDEGLAWAFIEYSGDYIAAEAAAKAAGQGIWRAPTQTAWDYRADRWARAVAASPAGCPIKGNISGDEHIYHTPWSAYYERVRMDPDKGERWFCDEAEAQAAGWRPAQSR